MASSLIDDHVPFEYHVILQVSDNSSSNLNWAFGSQFLQEPDFLGAIICLLGALLSVLLYSLAYNIYLGPISNIPGPFLAKVSPFWLMRAALRKTLNREIQDLHNKYGPVVRLSPTEVSFATVEAQTAIHRPGGSAKQNMFFTKEGTLEAMMGKIIWTAENLLTSTDPKEHQRLKRAMQPAFTEKSLQAQEPIQQRHTDRLISLIQQELETSRTIDLTPLISQTTWDIISDLSFGEPLLKDQLAKFERLKAMFCMASPLLEALQVLLAVPGARTLTKLFVDVIPFLFRLPTNILPSAQLRSGKIRRRDCKEDFLAAIMRCRELGISMTDEELLSNSSLLVSVRTQVLSPKVYDVNTRVSMVGYDTTATSISAATNLLLRHPKYLAALRHELISRFKSTAEMDAVSLTQLPLLNGCIHESLRLFPPANGKGTNRTSPGALIDGVFIPSGINVSADMYTIQRSVSYWARPNEFCPERWFDNGPGTEFAKDVRSSHCPFLLGPRMCIGRAVALQSMRLMLAKMVFRFDMEAAEDYNWETDVPNSYLWMDYRCLVSLRDLQ